MSLAQLPLELLQLITKRLNYKSYTRLHRASKQLYSRRLPFVPKITNDDLVKFVNNAPPQLVRKYHFKQKKLPEKIKVRAFVLGIQNLCTPFFNQKKINQKQVLPHEWIPECVKKADAQLKHDGRKIELTLLHIAAMFGHTHLCMQLVQNGANIDAQDSRWKTPLSWAVCGQHADVCRLLIQMGANYGSMRGEYFLPFHFAAQHGYIPVMESMILGGAHVNSRCSKSTTALERAVQHNQIQAVQWLLDNGADVDDNSVNRLLSIVIPQHHKELFEILFKHFESLSTPPKYYLEIAVYFAAIDNDVDLCTALLQKGAAPNGDPSAKTSPLSATAVHNAIQVCELLLDHGVSPDGDENSQHSPIALAALNGNLEICKLLLQKGASLWVGNPKKVSPLNAAYERALNKDIHDLFVKHDPEIVQWSGKQGTNGALHRAARNANLELVTHFVENGVPVDSRDNDGNTPFILAARSCCYEVCEYLLSKGANINRENRKGWNALANAGYDEDDNLCNWLLDRGADISRAIDGRRRYSRGGKYYVMDWMLSYVFAYRDDADEWMKAYGDDDFY